MKNDFFPRMHVSLYVSDLNKTLAFYNSFFGVQPEKVKPAYAKYILEKPSLIISFVENAERVQENFGHLGFQVETSQELDLRLAKAKVAGLVSLEEIGTRCCYALQDKFWVADPDGIQWEIYYFKEDSEFNDPHFQDPQAEVCCTPVEKRKLNLSELGKELSKA